MTKLPAYITYFIFYSTCILHAVFATISVYACDRDGVCESGETASNCVFDCMIASKTKDVKLYMTAGPTNKATYYKIDGTKQVITNETEALSFLAQHLDLTINRWLNEDIPSLEYRSSGMIKPYNDPSETTPARYREWLGYDKHEEWFVHDKDDKEKRIIRKTYNTYMADPGSGYSDNYTNWTQFYIDNNTNLDGAFLDETTGYLNLNLYYIADKVVNEITKVRDGGGGENFNYIITNNKPICSSLPVTVRNCAFPTQTYNIYGIWKEFGIIFFEKENSPAPETEVSVDYYFNERSPTMPENITDDYWKTSMTTILQKTRQKIGGKLLIYNGYSYSKTYDEVFLEHADGAMIEGMFTIPWRPISDIDNSSKPIDKETWEQQVDYLQKRSSDKIFLVSSGGDTENNTATDAQIRKAAGFSFTSFLLGKGKYAFFNFVLGGQYGSATENFVFFEEWATDLGNPLGKYNQRGNYGSATVYQRWFEKALVLVNPSSSDASVNDLTQTYYYLNGQPAGNPSSPLSLSFKSGVILKTSGGTTTPLSTTTTSIGSGGGSPGGGGGGETPISTTTTTTSGSGGGGSGGGSTTSSSTTTTSVPPTTTTTIKTGCFDNDTDGFLYGEECQPIDCNDDDAAIHPAAEEICIDGKDNNCDGSFDENCQVGCQIDILFPQTAHIKDKYAIFFITLKGSACRKGLLMGQILSTEVVFEGPRNDRTSVKQVASIALNNIVLGLLSVSPHAQPGVYYVFVHSKVRDASGAAVRIMK